MKHHCFRYAVYIRCGEGLKIPPLLYVIAEALFSWVYRRKLTNAEVIISPALDIKLTPTTLFPYPTPPRNMTRNS